MKVTSRFKSVAGVISLAALVVVGLTACGAPSGGVDQKYLVTDNVNSLTCPTTPAQRASTVKSLQSTANFVQNASAKQTNDILALNDGTTSTKPLSTALDKKITECKGSAKSAANAGTTPAMVTDKSGKMLHLAVYNGNGTPVTVDSTKDPNTAPLLTAPRYVNNTVSWADFVKRVGSNNQWYIDGLNARASATFDWENVKKYAQSTNVDARIIQVFNWKMDATAARNKVRPYLGNVVDQLPVINYGDVVNTTRVDTASGPQMADFVDHEPMVRVSLVAIIYDDKGNPVALDGSGAGIFIDCANLHWVPAAEVCTAGTPCTPPPPPPAPQPTPTPPSTPPVQPPVCTSGCGGTPPPSCTYDCAKDKRLSVASPGGVGTARNDGYETPQSVAPPAQPAPVRPAGQTPTSTSQAPGATAPDPNRTVSSPGTGTTPSGGSGSVNPAPSGGSTSGTGGSNNTDPGNPYQ